MPSGQTAAAQTESITVANEATAPAPIAQAKGCELLAGLDATFLMYRPGRGEWRACNPERAGQRFLPASTFKIANALIGLETGAVADERQVTKWDGRTRAVPAWNQDTDLAGGMYNSTVWFYQAMARRIGAAKMREWVGKLGYGNGDIGPDADIAHFWLDGDLRISAREEVAFVDRLRRRTLPLSLRSQDIVARILERDRGEGWVLRAKPGAVLPIDPDTGDLLQGPDAGAILHGAEPVGWWIGWIGRVDTGVGGGHGDGDTVFAFNMTLRGNGDLPLRERLARQLLVANGALPAGD
ncbi:MAG TPA: penicillin-binding transpeptidase domain-containing protein [Luteimonas sp.]|nr:penicillin-binding transpeptidase domain-containing protein [Luteimonas sp.]